MTYDDTTGRPAGPQGSRADAARDVAHHAQDEASTLAHGAQEGGRRLAQEARTQAGDVAHEARDQAREVLGVSRHELTEQAAAQQKKVAGGLRSLGQELDTMAHASDEPGLASDLARQLAGRADGVATWLDEREPGALLEEVTTFARQRPGTFLAIAAGAGLLAGRLTRGLKDAGSGDGSTAAPGTTSTPSGTATPNGTGTSTADVPATPAPAAGTVPQRTSAFAPAAPPASGATYGASADETAVYGTGAYAGAPGEGAAWDASSGTGGGEPLTGVEGGGSEHPHGAAQGADAGYGAGTEEPPGVGTASPVGGAYGGGTQDPDPGGAEAGGPDSLGGGASEVPERTAPWSPVHDEGRDR